jgi:hypothetical protein
MVAVPWVEYKSQARALPFHPTAAVGQAEFDVALRAARDVRWDGKCRRWLLLFIGENPPGFAGADCCAADKLLRHVLEQRGRSCGGVLGDRFVVLRANTMMPQTRLELGSAIDGQDPAIPRLIVLGALRTDAATDTANR